MQNNKWQKILSAIINLFLAGKFACCVLGQGTQRDAPAFMWKTGGPVFPLKRGLMAGRASDRKNKCHVIKMQISAVATPNRE